MPKKGQRATHCKRGHDLTVEGARLPVAKGGRGAGGCRQCSVERHRARRGSHKSGPPSRYKGDEVARLAALAAGMKRCPQCEEAKSPQEFNRDAGSPDGLSCYCRTCRGRQKRRDYAENRHELGLRRRSARFGITVEALVELINNHAGLCAVCRRECVSGRSLAVDHNHKTGEVRGMLCANCNRALGLLQDDPEIARAAWEYLARWNDAQSNEGVQ